MLLPETLKTILTSSKFITEEDFDSAQKSAEDLGKSVTDILVFRGLLSEDVLGQLIAEYYHVPFVKLRNKKIPQEILHVLSEEASRTFRVVPFSQDKNQIQLAMENPRDLEAIEFIKRTINRPFLIFFALPEDLGKAIAQYKRNIKALFGDIIKENVAKTKETGADAATSGQELPIIKMLDAVLEYAHAESASDIHIEALETEMVVRFRVDGILRDILSLPKTIHPALVARIKILSSLKIDEHRIPQDGRFKMKLDDDLVAFRVSILPSFFGENIVMRLLAESSRPLSLEELGITGTALALVKNNITKPNGMILVTGPTGSGKTTTLYSILNILNTPTVNVCTVEDPIEYGIRRVTQVQVNPGAGLTFAAGLRSLLRHDPNIIMVGEIRDSETAEMAIHSALTGHLVLSTLHTNSAAGDIPRFLDMRAEGFLLASTVKLIIAQRLVRKICSNCMESYTPAPDLLLFVKEKFKRELAGTFYHGKGCGECNNSGYKGRIGVYELLEVNSKIRELIAQRVAEEEIENEAIKNGMEKLLENGLNKVSAGITTINEIVRIAKE